MKKVLLALAAAVVSVSSAFAATVGDTYTKVASSADLTVGDEYIICYETNAMGGKNSSKSFYDNVADGVTINGDVAKIENASVMSFTIVEGTAAGTYAFKLEDGKFISCTNIANGNTDSAATLGETSNMNITLSSGVATIIFTKNSNNNSNKFQYNTSSPRFTNYKTGTQKNCTLYKKDSGGYTVLAPSIACVDNVVTITNNEEGASVYYTIDGTEPDANSTLYTAPFAITETCTVKAVAIKDGESSITTTYNATFVAPAEVEPFTSSIAAVDDVITAARGTEITFTSLHAAKIEAVIAIEGQDGATESVESDKFVYTVSGAASIMLTSYNVDGTEAHSALYEIALEAAPLCGELVFNPASGSAVIAGSEVTITCENAATITYIIEINGELGDAIEVEGNEAKVVVNEACTIHADAKNIDGVPSEAAEASYTIAEAPATGDFTFVFGVDGQNVIKLANKEIAVSSESSKLEDLNNLDGVKFTAPDGCSIEFSIGTSRNAPRFFKSASSVKNPATDHVRVYNGNTMTVSVPEGTVITSLSFTQVTNATTWTEMPADPAGTWSGKTWTPAPAASAMMREAAKGVESVTFKPTGTTHFATVTVNYERPTTGVGSVVVDDANAPVEYYNLQGVRVENPANGLYIRRQGNNVSKVFVR